MAAAPAIVKFVGGTPTDAIHHSLRMRAITLGANPSFTLPALDFAAAAAGIDARKVVDCGVLPVINSGIAHREAGVGQIGAGVTTAPMACFTAAVKALARELARPTGALMNQKPLAVVAVGGNALIRDAQHTALADQYDAVCATAAHVVDMIAAGWNVVLTHGNGPQVGFILRRSEIADGQVPTVPVQYAVGDTQGAIGFMFQNALGNALRSAAASTCRSSRWSRRRWSIVAIRPSRSPTSRSARS